MKQRNYIMRLRNKSIFVCSQLLFLIGIIVGCSDNIESGFYVSDRSNLSLSVSAEGVNNGLLIIGPSQYPTVFTVNSTTRWTAKVTGCEGGWCRIRFNTSGEDAFCIGDGTFSVETDPNRSDKNRECDIMVYAVKSDGTQVAGETYSVHIEQSGQVIKIDYEGEVIPNVGATIKMSVTANQAWTVTTNQSWVTVIPGGGMEGNYFTPEDGSTEERTVEFNIKVDTNTGTATRYADVIISSPTSAFASRSFNITQEGSTETFFITPLSVPEISHLGGDIKFEIFSPRDGWTVKILNRVDWLSLDRTSGSPSSEVVLVHAHISPNLSDIPRSSAIVLTRSGGMGDTQIIITQSAQPASTEPTVSTAWIETGWTATNAQLRAYVDPASAIISKYGAVIFPIDNPEARRIYDGYISGGNMIIVDMDGLEPNTDYEAAAFIEFNLFGKNGTLIGETTRFRTPNRQEGATPSIGNNHPPIFE